MIIQTILIVFCCALLIVVILTPIAKRIGLSIKAIDKPDGERKIHSKPTVRLGGLAIFISINLCIVWEILFCDIIAVDKIYIHKAGGILLAGLLIFILGVIDDCFQLSAKVKLAGQIVCTVIVILFGNRIILANSFFINDTGIAHVISIVLTLFWVIGITNAINIIDGLDGLAAGVVGIANVALCYIAYSTGYYFVAIMFAIVAGAAIGFLPYNLYPAKIFMGDCGSMYLGFIIGCLSLLQPVKSASFITYIMVLMTLLIPLTDIGFAMLKRIAIKEPVIKADKNHFHYVLMRYGMGQRRIVAFIYTVAALAGMDAIIYCKGLRTTALLVAVLIIMQVAIISLHRSHDDS